MLAIGAHSFCLPSETFIHNHVRIIAPGETILLCEDGVGAERFGCPVLSYLNVRIEPCSLLERISGALNRRRQTYIDPGLTGDDRRRVRAFFEIHKPKAVLAEYGDMGVLLARACEEAGVPLYVHFHGYCASVLLKEQRWIKHYRNMFKRAAGVIAPSRFLADKLADIGCPADKLHVSPYGIDPNRFAPALPRPQHILAVGRFVEKKAPHLTIMAFAQVAARFPQARLDMVGDGPLAGRCQGLVTELGLKERVHLHGVRSPDFIARLMRQSAIFVQHSVTAENGDTEGLPVAILEAMASALPVVSTRHSGIPEAVEEGVTGLLVGERDVNAMAKAMASLLEDGERAKAMGCAGRERVLAHFTHEKARDRLRNIMGMPTLTEHGPQLTSPIISQVTA